MAILHIVNNLELPVSLTKSYSVYAGATDPARVAVRRRCVVPGAAMKAWP